MLIYTVHAPPAPKDGPPETVEERADALVFVKDGFSWPTFLFGPFWLASHRLWRALVGYIVVLAAIEAVLALIPGGMGASGPVLLLASLAFGLEAGSIRRWALERRGYRLIGSAAGRSFDECEHRFLAGWIGADTAPRPRTA